MTSVKTAENKPVKTSDTEGSNNKNILENKGITFGQWDNSKIVPSQCSSKFSVPYDCVSGLTDPVCSDLGSKLQ